MTLFRFHQLLLDSPGYDVVIEAQERAELFNDIKEVLMRLEELETQIELSKNDMKKGEYK